MAQIHNAIKYGTDFLRAFARAVGLDEQEGGVERLGETLTPIMDLWSQPEWRFLFRDRIMGGAFDVTSAVTDVPSTMLFNPEGSGVLGVMTRLQFQNVTIATTFSLAFVRAAVAPAGFVAVNSGPLDTRDPQLIAASASQLRVLQDSEVAGTTGGLNFDTISMVIGQRHQDVEPVVLAPGTGVLLTGQANAVNTIRGSWRWRERRFLPGEQARAQ